MRFFSVTQVSERDNVRLGAVGRTAGIEDQAWSVSLSASRNRLEQRQNQRSTEEFLIRHLADHHFFNGDDASPSKNQEALRKQATLHLTNAREVDLAAMLKTLRSQYNIRTLACEGGPDSFRSLLEQGFQSINSILQSRRIMFGGGKHLR